MRLGHVSSDWRERGGGQGCTQELGRVGSHRAG